MASSAALWWTFGSVTSALIFVVRCVRALASSLHAGTFSLVDGPSLGHTGSFDPWYRKVPFAGIACGRFFVVACGHWFRRGPT